MQRHIRKYFAFGLELVVDILQEELGDIDELKSYAHITSEENKYYMNINPDDFDLLVMEGFVESTFTPLI